MPALEPHREKRPHDALIVIDRQGYITDWDEQAAEMFGLPYHKVTGQPLCDVVVAPPYRESYTHTLKQFLTGYSSKFLNTEVEVQDCRGRVFPAELMIASPRSEAKAGLTAVVRDVSPLREAEYLKGLLAAIVESSDDAIISMSKDGVITSWNDAAQKMFGYSSDEAVGRNIDIIIPPEAEKEQRRLVLDVQEGKQIKHYETVRLNKDGHHFTIDMTVSPVRETSGEINGCSMIIQDITERKLAEADVQRYVGELERSNRNLEEFSHLASHDLKEPLRGLSMLSSIVLEDNKDKLDTTGVRQLSEMTSLARRMEELVRNLLYFSKLGNEKLAIQETDLNELVREISEMIMPLLVDRGAQILVPDRLPIIVCDKTRITEVFRNLITNAIKHNDKKEPVVEVGFLPEAHTSRGTEKIVFYVKDNGPGIDPQHQKTIFSVFRKLPASDKKARSGTGSGLGFVKKIIDRHNGHIWLESTPAEGTTFFFTIGQIELR